MNTTCGMAVGMVLAALVAGGCTDDDNQAAESGTDDVQEPSDLGSVDDVGDADAGSTGDDDTGAAEPDTDSLPALECGTDSPEAFGACVDTARMDSDLLAVLTTARPAGTAGALAAREYCKTQLEGLGYTVETQSYGTGANVVGVLPGTDQPDQVVLIGAHFDSEPNCAGADDNGSGVAGVLEAARALAQTSHARTLAIACWDEEELGLVGSSHWVRQAVNQGKQVVVSFNFEMIGYYSDEPGSQTLPAGFDILFKNAAQQVADNEFRGDFIALIADSGAAAYVANIEKHAAVFGIPALKALVPEPLMDLGQTGDLRRSDHAPFWDERMPAVMLTDTANFRNPNYHCAAGPDAYETLDLVRAGKVVSATVAAAVEALQAGDPAEGSAGRPPECGLQGPACPEGQRCSVTINGVGKWKPFCTPLAAEPAGRNQECSRPGNTVGEDSCNEGLFCAFWGVPKADPPTRQCLALCTSTSGCEPGEVCMLPDPSSIAVGLCVAQCDPFADACAEGLSCRYWRRAIEDASPVHTCLWTGTIPEGQPCTWGLGSECADGLNCVISPLDGTTACRAYCNADHPCGAGFTCVPDRGQDPQGDTGFCQPQ